MPLARLIAAVDLGAVADHGLTGERTYPEGQLVVNFADANKAVLRPRSRMPDSVMFSLAEIPLGSLWNIRPVTFRPNRVRS